MKKALLFLFLSCPGFATTYYSVNLSGTNAGIGVSTTTANNLSKFSVSVWAKITSNSSGFGQLIGKAHDQDGAPGWFMYIHLDHVWFLTTRPGTQYYVSTGGSDHVVDGNWHNFIATYDKSSSAKIYIDGIDYTTGFSGGSPNFDFSSPVPISLGDFSRTYNLVSKLTACQIWDRVLTKTEITFISNGGFLPRDPLVSWRMTEGSGLTVANEEADSNNLITFDAVTWSSDIPTTLPPALPAYGTTVVYVTSTGTWSAHTDGSPIMVEAIGGGGGGAGSPYGGGGGAGEYRASTMSYTSNSSVSVTIGNAGIGGIFGAGTDGGDTIFGSNSVVAKSGKGALSDDLGGTGGTGGTGLIGHNGGTGGVGSVSNEGGGGGGAAGPNGVGLVGGTATAGGGAGGGAGASGGTVGSAGGVAGGGNGGNNFSGLGHGVGGTAGVAPTSGTNGGGGGGAADSDGSFPTTGADGGDGADWDSTHGSGGGGGGEASLSL